MKDNARNPAMRRNRHRRPDPTALAFTLIELLVVISVIAVLIGVLIPALGSARQSGRKAVCLSNLRNLETAHTAFIADNDGRLIGTSHGESWITILRDRYDPNLLFRSPLDDSPHFAPDGIPIGGKFRLSSYGINMYTSPDGVKHGLTSAVDRLERVRVPSKTVHFVITSFRGSGAVSDHVHPQLWPSGPAALIPIKAAGEMQTNAHGGPEAHWDSMSAYGFLDGHAESRPFRDIYKSPDENNFDPAVAQ